MSRARIMTIVIAVILAAGLVALLALVRDEADVRPPPQRTEITPDLGRDTSGVPHGETGAVPVR